MLYIFFNKELTGIGSNCYFQAGSPSVGSDTVMNDSNVMDFEDDSEKNGQWYEGDILVGAYTRSKGSSGDRIGGGSAFVGTLRPGTPGPGGHPTMHYLNRSFRKFATPPRKTASLIAENGGSANGVPSKRASFEKDNNGSNGVCVP